MSRFMQRISVPFEYPVYFTSDLFSRTNGDLIEALSAREPTRRHRVDVIVDSQVAAAWPSLLSDVAGYADAHADRMQLAAAPLVLAGGEGSKNDPAILQGLYARFRELALDRHCFVLIIGGGALLDVVGYAAASTHRGVRVVRVPTTVLGQADSGVGVKNGVNMFGAKNYVGSFAPPFAVLNDPRFLRTLERRDRIAGMAEAVKVALIRDASFFRWIEDRADALAAGDEAALAHLCQRSAELHLAHIRGGGDPFELGSARPLDFGHWAAHKLESMSGYRVRHGEAVAIGMALDTIYALRKRLLGVDDARAVRGLLEALGFRLWDDALAATDLLGRPTILDGLDEFREHLGGELTITLLRGVGRGVEVNTIDEAVMRASLRELEDAAGAPQDGKNR